jgi:hypothetical protein
MLKDPTEDELQEFFEEVWLLAERIAVTDDSHWAPRLFELAEEIAAWRSDLQGRPASSLR